MSLSSRKVEAVSSAEPKSSGARHSLSLTRLDVRASLFQLWALSEILLRRILDTGDTHQHLGGLVLIQCLFLGDPWLEVVTFYHFGYGYDIRADYQVLMLPLSRIR